MSEQNTYYVLSAQNLTETRNCKLHKVLLDSN